ncbi:hypothetical protein CANARDRAFT_202939 [[Candida] arabinofermentans NRRL YB-2248]|uniref:DNA mismatch repair protein MSH6 n=1 Tax=[Candida] arabinofermentans NRRL YB-2248 TaxID=983967 RepID=A0A1E4SVC5_9ASCO|nr:hypothetical protein CANARDRAFT_202939 [[Candida] arabinofermentans NRRL YB-2248]
MSSELKTPAKKLASFTTKPSPSPKLKQASLLSFFSKKPAPTTKSSSDDSTAKSKDIVTPASSSPLKGSADSFDKTSANTSLDIPQKKEASKKIETQKEVEPISTPKSLKKVNSSAAFDSFLDDSEADVSVVPSSPLTTTGRRVKKINYAESDNEDNESDEDGGISKSTNRKRRKVVIDDDDDDDDFKLDNEQVSDDDPMDADVVPDDFEDDKMDFDDDDDLDEVLEKAEKMKSKKSSTQSKKEVMKDISNTSFASSSLASKFTANSSLNTDETAQKTVPFKRPFKSETSAITPQKKFAKENEERYQWLIDIKDADGRSQTDPEYDPRTLYIPKVAWQKFTAFETQYWEIKSKMWDSVVFFKKGKFYELYEKDADLAHQKFDLKLAGTGRANMRLAGIPEMSFNYWAKRFVDEGYKVAKVDQKESMLAKEIREKNGATSSKEDKVIKRELSCVLTCGTLTDENMLSDEMAKYCLSIKEVTNFDNTKTFGVCFVDTATGKMQLTQFNDDPECNKLETLLTQVQPMEVLVEKSNISSFVMKLLRFNSHPAAIFNFLKPQEEFWDHEQTFEQLVRGKYFEAEDLDDLSNYPPTLVKFHEKSQTVGFSAFGALVWYLKSLKLDESIISMGNVDQYDPFTSSFAKTSMRLDGVTLQNLEIFTNSFDQSDKGTLFKLLNRAVTPFGKRLFRNWIVHPLMNQDKIESRLDSVEALLNDGELKSLLESKLAKLPDIERMLARIHSGTLKIKEFTKVVEGFEIIRDLVTVLKQTYGADCSALGGDLGKIISSFPAELDECVDRWSGAFDRQLASSEGILVPEVGIEPEFDESNAEMKRMEKELDDIMRDYRREFKAQEMCYRDSGKEIYLIEVPIKAVSKVPKDWQQMAATAKCKRYWSPKVKLLVRKLMEARELHKILSESLQQKMYAKFDKDYEIWSLALKHVSEVDCLISLVRSSESLGSPVCRPTFIDNDRAEIEFKELRHPCFIPGGSSGTKDFIPNDISLGVNNENQIGLLTGANAAGKSTLLRMTCVAVIMAQIGCFIPATSARLTPIDSIMTRLGANDNIMQGKSTFFVELSETKRILEMATPKSLIILDELGRGGSSSDGFAIAEAVLHHIATHIQSIGYFATHYGTLYNSFTHHPAITPLRMGILVEDDSRDITFLYKLEPGRSSGSFGMHVAAMCGVNKEIVDNAEIAAKTWEYTSRLKNATSEVDTIPLGLTSDISWLINKRSIGDDGCAVYNDESRKNALAIKSLTDRTDATINADMSIESIESVTDEDRTFGCQAGIKETWIRPTSEPILSKIEGNQPSMINDKPREQEEEDDDDDDELVVTETRRVRNNRKIPRLKVNEKIEELSKIGDLRNAINLLEYWYKFLYTSKSSSQMLGKETGLNVFHSVGKIIYGTQHPLEEMINFKKRNYISSLTLSPEDGEYDDLLMRSINSVTVSNVTNDIVATSSNFQLNLLENYSMVSRGSLSSTLVDLVDDLSLSDVLMSQSNLVTSGSSSMNNVVSLAISSYIGCLGVRLKCEAIKAEKSTGGASSRSSSLHGSKMRYTRDAKIMKKQKQIQSEIDVYQSKRGTRSMRGQGKHGPLMHISDLDVMLIDGFYEASILGSKKMRMRSQKLGITKFDKTRRLGGDFQNLTLADSEFSIVDDNEKKEMSDQTLKELESLYFGFNPDGDDDQPGRGENASEDEEFDLDPIVESGDEDTNLKSVENNGVEESDWDDDFSDDSLVMKL